MPFRNGKRKWLWLTLAVFIALLLYAPAADLVLAARLMQALRSLAAGDTGENLSITETRVRRRFGDREVEALLYGPSGTGATRAVVLAAGVSELGCYHPRLVALSRALADKGFLVLTPDIRMFREFRISPEVVDEISFWHGQMPRVEGAESVRRFGLAGISFSGTLAIIAAARPENIDTVDFILGIGCYDDLLDCSRSWFEAGPVTMSPGYFPTRYYGRWVVMMTALDLLPLPEEREFLRGTLMSLLLQKERPPAPQELSDEALRWLRLATGPEDESDPELASQIEAHLAPGLYRQLSPAPAAPLLRCPVFLAHGAHDDLIPSGQSSRLRERLVGAESWLLVSPFLTHTHPMEKPLGRWEQVRAATGVFEFLYQLAAVVR